MRHSARWTAVAVAGLAGSLGVGCQVGPDIGGTLGPGATIGSGDAGTGTGSGTDAGSDDTADADDTSADGNPLPSPECSPPAIACGQICADIDVDASNCGGCGIGCVVANAVAVCALGDCALGQCDAGWADCDGDLATGCEAAVDCAEGSPCTTECGSDGVMSCADACAPSCAAPVETCNALDDDCDAACDEGPLPGCRIPVHRAISGPLGHFYTTDLAEVGALGLTMEVQDFFFVYAEPVDGLVPLFRCNKAGGRRFLTSSIDCEGTGAPELTMGFVSPDDRCGSVSLYRLYAAGNDDHFYTTSVAERDNAIATFGYADQGSAGFVFTAL